VPFIHNINHTLVCHSLFDRMQRYEHAPSLNQLSLEDTMLLQHYNAPRIQVNDLAPWQIHWPVTSQVAFLPGMNASAGHGYTFQRRWTACMLHTYLVSTKTSCVPDCGSSSILILDPGAYGYAAAMSRDSAATRMSLIGGNRNQRSYPGVVYGYSEREETPFPVSPNTAPRRYYI